MLWEESEKTGRGCSYILLGAVLLVGVACTIAAFVLRDWRILKLYSYALALFGAVVLVWVLASGGILCASLGVGRTVSRCLGRLRGNQETK